MTEPHALMRRMIPRVSARTYAFFCTPELERCMLQAEEQNTAAALCFQNIHTYTRKVNSLEGDEDYGAHFSIPHVIRGSDCHLHRIFSLGYKYSLGDIRSEVTRVIRFNDGNLLHRHPRLI